MPNKLPQGWVECQLEDILSNEKYSIKRGPFGSSLKKTFFVPAGIRVFEQYNPINNDPYWSRYYITESKYKELEAFTAKAGDFLISCSGTLGKILQLPVDVELGIINQALLKITVNNDLINSKFFINLFQSPKFQKNILDNTIGTAIQNIASVKELKKIKILLPPLNEQRRIVEKIESEFAKIDEGLEHLEQAKEQIKQYRQSVLKSAFEGKLYKTTEWIERELINLCKSISAGGDRPEIYSETPTQDCKIPIYSNGIKDNGLYGYTNLARIKESAVTVSARGTIGFVCARYKPYFPIVRLISVIPELSLLDIEFLKYFLSFVVPKGEGSSIPQLTVPNFKKYSIILPTLEEQKKIVEEIEKRFAVADEVEKVVEENIEKAKQLKQSILKKAFEGRLVPQDPTDEPASTLLEKIKQGRSKK